MRKHALLLLVVSALLVTNSVHSSDDSEPATADYKFDHALFTKPYKSNEYGAYFLPPGMKWRVMPRYVGRAEDGKTYVDDRVTLTLQDSKRGFMPFIAKMDLKDAEALQKSLSAVIAEKKKAAAKAKD